jgi:hypothetical protein
MMKKILMICAILIGVAGLASAAPTYTITFDEFPLGTLIDTQYAPLGVVFLPGIVTPRLPQISLNGAMPTEPVLRATGEPDFYIFQGDFFIEFPTPVVDVQFLSGYWDTVGSGIIEVYGPYGNLLASLSNTATGPVTTDLSALGKIGKIYFNSVGDGAGADLDNLSFSPIPAPGAIVLGGIGVGLIGWLRRRRTL